MAPYHTCISSWRLLDGSGLWPPTLFIGQTEAGRAKKEAKPASRWAGPPLLLVLWNWVDSNNVYLMIPQNTFVPCLSGVLL